MQGSSETNCWFYLRISIILVVCTPEEESEIVRSLAYRDSFPSVARYQNLKLSSVEHKGRKTSEISPGSNRVMTSRMLLRVKSRFAQGSLDFKCLMEGK